MEEILGTLRSHIRANRGAKALDRMRVHTKVVPDRSMLASVNRGYVARIVDRSLARLGVDQLDLVQFAWWDYSVPGYLECAHWLSELQSEGKIGELGATNFDAVRLTEILNSGVRLTAHQVQYSALDARPEPEMGPLCYARGVKMLCYGALAGGLLTDRWLGQPDPAPGGVAEAMALESRSLTKYRLIVEDFGGWEDYQTLLKLLHEIGDKRGATIAQVALAYALSRPGVSSVILGLTNPERFHESMRGAALELTPGEAGRIHSLSAVAPGPAGPVFAAERDPDSPHAAIMKYDLNQGLQHTG